MLARLGIWIMRFVLLGMIYYFLYKVIKVMYNDLKRSNDKRTLSMGIEVIEINSPCTVPKGAVYPLRPIITIGRLQDNDIVLDSEYVSGRHARIYLKNNAYILKDMGSTNGTLLNGQKVDKPSAIKNGDNINIGGIVFKVID